MDTGCACLLSRVARRLALVPCAFAPSLPGPPAPLAVSPAHARTRTDVHIQTHTHTHARTPHTNMTRHLDARWRHTITMPRMQSMCTDPTRLWCRLRGAGGGREEGFVFGCLGGTPALSLHTCRRRVRALRACALLARRCLVVCVCVCVCVCVRVCVFWIDRRRIDR